MHPNRVRNVHYMYGGKIVLKLAWVLLKRKALPDEAPKMPKGMTWNEQYMWRQNHKAQLVRLSVVKDETPHCVVYGDVPDDIDPKGASTYNLRRGRTYREAREALCGRSRAQGGWRLVRARRYNVPPENACEDCLRASIMVSMRGQS